MKFNKRIIMYLALTVSVTAVSIILPIVLAKIENKDRKQSTELVQSEVITGDDIVTENGQTEGGLDETTNVTEPMTETKENGAESVKMDLKNLESFLSEQQIIDLEQKIKEVMPEQTKSIKNLKYQKSSAENMDVTFYLLTDKGNILKGKYNFQFGTFSIKRSKLTAADISKMQEKEQNMIAEADRIAKEAAAAKAREAERVQAEKIKEQAAQRAEEKSKETEVKKEGES